MEDRMFSSGKRWESRFVIELAALLHDLGDAKFHDGIERSKEFIAILQDL